MSEILHAPRVHRGLGFTTLGLVGSLLLGGCGGPDITEGTVVGKSHRNAFTAIIPLTTCRSVGKMTSCTTTFVPLYHPESYDLTIENCAVKPPDATECPSRVFGVNKEQYNTTTIGSHYRLSPDQLSQYLAMGQMMVEQAQAPGQSAE